MTRQKRNFTEGDIVLLKDNSTFRNKWPMARVLVAVRDDNGQVRSVTVQSATGSMLDRPVNKRALLLESPEESLTSSQRNCFLNKDRDTRNI